MSDLLLLTSTLEPAAEILPALGLLLHPVRVGPAEVPPAGDAPPADAILVEARLRLAIGRRVAAAPATPDEIRSGDLAIDEAT